MKIKIKLTSAKHMVSSEKYPWIWWQGQGLTIKVVLRKAQGRTETQVCCACAYSRYKQAITLKWKAPKKELLLRCEMKLKLLRQLRWMKTWKANIWKNISINIASLSRGRGCMYTCCWFTLLYSRNQHNTEKQLSSNLKKEYYISISY